MLKKLITLIISSAFIFILVMTAWDYWPSKSGHHTAFSTSVIKGNQFKAAEPQCHSLHDAYEVLSRALNVAPSVAKNILPPPPVVVRPSFSIRILSNLYDRPPPLASPPSAVPLFQLYCNLRI